MRNPLPLRIALLCLALLACTGSTAASLDQRPWPVLQRYLAAWNAHSSEDALRSLDAEAIYFSSSAGTPRPGREAIAEVLDGLLGLIPDLRWEVLGEPLRHGSGIAFEWQFSGHAQLAGDPVPRPLRLRGASFARVENGRIVYLADYYNGLSMQQQLAP